MDGRARERGAALVVVSLALVMVLVGIWLLTALTGRVVDRTRAQSAADASALAGVADGRSAAEALARTNGATLVSFEQNGGVVEVVVAVDGVIAVARAERRLAPP